MSNDNFVCEAVGCHSKADTEVRVKVAKGMICLFLCSTCKSKLRLDESTLREISQLRHTASKEDDNS